ERVIKGELQPTPIARKANRLLRSPLEVAWLGYHSRHQLMDAINKRVFRLTVKPLGLFGGSSSNSQRNHITITGRGVKRNVGDWPTVVDLERTHVTGWMRGNSA
ncbi:hypothetical protein J6590_039025, partial [Homalodisca vitripennis]